MVKTMKVKRSKSIKSRRTKVKAIGGGLREKFKKMFSWRSGSKMTPNMPVSESHLPPTELLLNKDNYMNWPNLCKIIWGDSNNNNKVSTFFKNNTDLKLTIINTNNTLAFDEKTIKTLHILFQQNNTNESTEQSFDIYIKNIQTALSIDAKHKQAQNTAKANKTKVSKSVDINIFKNVLDVLYFFYSLKFINNSNKQSNEQDYEDNFWKIYKNLLTQLTQLTQSSNFRIFYIYLYNKQNKPQVNSAKIINNADFIKYFNIVNDDIHAIHAINTWLVDAINKFIEYCCTMNSLMESYIEDSKKRAQRDNEQIDFNVFWTLDIQNKVNNDATITTNKKNNIEYPKYPFLKNDFTINKYVYVDKCY
jgi:hypothetical protein